MALTFLSIHDLRNIHFTTLTPCSRLNLIIGANGSGKTSILEAIYLLGRGKSFRSAYSRKIVRHDQPGLTVFGKSVFSDGQTHPLGIQIKEGRFRAKIDGKYEQKSSALAACLPLLLISPDGDKLIKGSPRQRRRFLDWALFHVEQEFLSVWQRYNRILQQRNTVLRQKNNAVRHSWDIQLVETAVELDKLRRNYASGLAKLAIPLIQRLLGIDDVEFRYQAGWPNGEDYGVSLDEYIESDIKAGFTQRGPHRADLIIRVAGRSAAEMLSGGQQKLAACALLLAQAITFNQIKRESCIILVDDLPAELDSHHRQLLMELLYSIGSQLFITATSEALLDISNFTDMQMFHVEQGVITS